MRSRLSNILWGLFFILIGIGFAGNAFNLWDFNLFFPGWWTFFIIIPCGISIIQNGFQTGTSIGLVIGVMLLLSRQGFFDMRLVGQLIIPVILVIVGLGIMFANTFQKTPRNGHFGPNGQNSSGSYGGESYTGANNYTAGSNSDWEHSTHANGSEAYTSTFAAQNINFDNEIFHGTTANAYFGAVDLHLENAIINENVTIYCNTTFGGIEIFLPNYVNVKVQSTPVFGGVTNRRRYMTSPDAPTVFINATCLFGGVEIK